MPVISVRHFLDLNVHYAFDAIRSARHPCADDIVGFLYDLLFLQQKTAIAILDYDRLARHAEENKGEARLTSTEVDAIMLADMLFAYLKASVEKTVALVGATFEVPGLDSKDKHRKRVAALRNGMPSWTDKVPYAEFMFSMIAADSLESLNNYRTGILHKKGIADLQPHNYVGQSAQSGPLRRVFAMLHEQHAKNTALLVGALALLTDRLVELDPPSFQADDLPWELLKAELPRRFVALEVDTSDRIREAYSTGEHDTLADLLLERARLRFHLARHDEAVADFREALAKGAEPQAELLCELGRSLMGTGPPERDMEAVDAFTRALSLSPNMDAALVGRALAYENLKEFARAAEDFESVVRRAPKPGAMLEKCGEWNMKANKFKEALVNADAAASCGYVSPEVLGIRGEALQALGNPSEALRAFDSALLRYPEAVAVRIRRAGLLIKSDDHVAARVDLDYIIEKHPQHPKLPAALTMRAVVLSNSGDTRGAAADVELAISKWKEEVPDTLLEFLQALRDGENQ